MASTNKTINYNLSQYVSNDKPTYLVDYNSDMNKIDTQMKANNDLAGLAKTEADDLSSRVDGQDVVIGTLNTTVSQHTSDINSLNTAVSNVNTKVGDLTNLNTTDKSDVVSAVNEVNTKVGDLTNLNTTDKTDIISAINEVKAGENVVDITSLITTKSNVTQVYSLQAYKIGRYININGTVELSSVGAFLTLDSSIASNIACSSTGVNYSANASAPAIIKNASDEITCEMFTGSAMLPYLEFSISYHI